jgi:hypothetical protein
LDSSLTNVALRMTAGWSKRRGIGDAAKLHEHDRGCEQSHWLWRNPAEN